jgi:hypothetical protein
MRKCESCVFWDKEYDKLQQEWDDMLIEGEKERHHCIWYRSHIPPEIYYEGADCDKHIERS